LIISVIETDSNLLPLLPVVDYRSLADNDLFLEYFPGSLFIDKGNASLRRIIFTDYFFVPGCCDKVTKIDETPASAG
jgi:hypothetical protein